MSVRDVLPSVLRGEAVPDLSPASRERLEALAHEAQQSGQLAWVRDECGGRLRQPEPPISVEYLLAAVCALAGEVERAHQTLLALGERLAVAKQWEPMVAVAERALALEETAAAVRLLVRAHEGLGPNPGRVGALERAWAHLPDDLEIALLLTVRLGEAGQGEHRRELLAELLPRFAAEKRYGGLEEAALEFVEHDAVDGLLRLVESLPRLAEDGAFAEAKQLLDIAWPKIRAARRAGEAAAPLRALAIAAAAKQGPTGAEAFRGAVVEAIPAEAAARLPDVARAVEASSLGDPMKPLVPAIEKFEQITALPPGRAVHHGSFGPGRILSNDTETVVIDFARSRGHKMPFAAARRTLTPIAEDDLRLLKLTQPDELKRLRGDDPGGMLVRALAALGGSGDAQKLKVFLVGSDLVPAAEWTAFWRRARAAAEKDARIDHARAFEQHYRLAPEGVAAGGPAARTPLPNLEPRKSVKSNLTTLRKFLTQHPQAEQALAQRFGRYLQHAVHDLDGDRADRARAGMYLARWYPERREEWAQVLRDLWEQGLSITDLPAEDEQLATLEGSHSAGVESDAILSALDSRFSAVREAAQRHRALLDDAGRADMRRTLLQHASRYPSAALRLVEENLETRPAPPDAWGMLFAMLMLAEEKPKPSVAEKVLRWLEPDGAFDRLLAGVPCDEPMALRIRVLLRQWRSSDRFLFPAMEALERLGLSAETGVVREARQQRTDRLFSSVGQQAEDVDLPVMTRATWQRLHKEMESLERELRTTIPQTIQKARELGDLRENAEYHSAKLKQSNVSKQVASLQRRLARARFVDDAEFKPGVVGLGARVTLESDGARATYWVLGDGEQHFGPEVVSFQSVVGRALMNHAIGDEIELGEGAQRRPYRIATVEHRLPETEDATH